jgi:hypothetical protein
MALTKDKIQAKARELQVICGHHKELERCVMARKCALLAAICFVMDELA